RDAARWLARRDDGDAWTPADEAALARWLDQGAAQRVAFLRLQAAWTHAGRLKALGAGARALPPRGAWSAAPHAHDDMDQLDAARDPAALVFAPRPPRSRSRALPAAAAAIVAVAVSAGGWFWHGFGAVEAGSHGTALGAVQTVALA